MEVYKNQADKIIQKVGGIKTLCDWTGEKYHVVWSWQNRTAKGFIPPEHYPVILLKAREAGIDLTERDFVFPLLTNDQSVDSSPFAQQISAPAEVV